MALYSAFPWRRPQKITKEDDSEIQFTVKKNLFTTSRPVRHTLEEEQTTDHTQEQRGRVRQETAEQLCSQILWTDEDELEPE